MFGWSYIDIPSLETNIVIHKMSLNERSVHMKQKLRRTRLDMVLKVKDEIEYNGKLSKVPVMTYKGGSMDLAEVCSKLFIISALSIRETGDSEILKAAENVEAQDFSGGTE